MLREEKCIYQPNGKFLTQNGICCINSRRVRYKAIVPRLHHFTFLLRYKVPFWPAIFIIVYKAKQGQISN